MLAATRLTARRLLIASVCLSTVWACTLVNSLDAYGPERPRADAGGDGALGTSSGGPGETCNRAVPPEAPGNDDGSDNLKLVFAVDALYIGSAPDAGTIGSVGYDLDGTCTCPGPASCLSAPLKGGGDAGPKCDGDGGIDNGGAQLIQTIVQSAGGDGDANEKITAGASGLLFQLAAYNGGMNDTQVQLTFFATGGTILDGDGNHTAPRHDGTDQWTVRRDSLFGGVGDGPNYIGAYRDDHAYVANGILVAHVDFPLAFGNLAATLNGTIVTARLTKTGSTYHLGDGRFVGRWLTKDLLSSLDTLPDPVTAGAGLCGTSTIYQQLKSEICASVDLRGRADEDSKNPLLDCDALGMLLSFDAETARLGNSVDKVEPTHYCGATYSDDCPTF